MSRRLLLGILAALAVLAVPFVLVSPDEEPVRSRMAGDIEDVVAQCHER